MTLTPGIRWPGVSTGCRWHRGQSRGRGPAGEDGGGGGCGDRGEGEDRGEREDRGGRDGEDLPDDRLKFDQKKIYNLK